MSGVEDGAFAITISFFLSSYLTLTSSPSSTPRALSCSVRSRPRPTGSATLSRAASRTGLLPSWRSASLSRQSRSGLTKSATLRKSPKHTLYQKQTGGQKKTWKDRAVGLASRHLLLKFFFPADLSIYHTGLNCLISSSKFTTEKPPSGLGSVGAWRFKGLRCGEAVELRSQ